MNSIDRRSFLLASVSTFATMALEQSAGAAHPRVTVGAIRWDPWYIQIDTGARVSMETTLGPSKWQGRAPSCASITSPDTIDFGHCGTQTQIDGEIMAANAAGLDYWAYVWYGPKHEMQTAWRLHQSSSIKSEMNWCMIFSGYSLFVREVANSADQYISYFRQNNYHKVVTNRPLIFLLHDTTSPASLRSGIEAMRAACTIAGIDSPYVVLLVGAVPGAGSAAGADAIGIYSKANSAPEAGYYSDLVNVVEAYWMTLAATGQSVIPTAVTGADRRPRVERPVPWEAATQKPYVGDDLYYAAGTPAQIAAHVSDMVAWIKANPGACTAQTGLIYSWDEHDEGGSTLNPTLSTGSAVLTAVGEMLRHTHRPP